MINKTLNSKLIKRVSLLLILSITMTSFKFQPMEKVILPAGELIPLETINNITSETSSVGDVVDFRVVRDIKVDGKTLIKAGSVAKGQIQRVDRKKGLGKPGYLQVTIKSVKAVDGTEIYLRGGDIMEEGQDKQSTAIILGVAVCILFLTMKGKDAVVPAGRQINNVFAASNYNINL